MTARPAPAEPVDQLQLDRQRHHSLLGLQSVARPNLVDADPSRQTGSWMNCRQHAPYGDCTRQPWWQLDIGSPMSRCRSPRNQRATSWRATCLSLSEAVSSHAGRIAVGTEMSSDGPGDASGGHTSSSDASCCTGCITAPSPIRVDLGHHDRSRPGRPTDCDLDLPARRAGGRVDRHAVGGGRPSQ